MKRFLIVILSMVFIVIIFVSIFIATFDIDNYKWLLASYIGSITNSHITIERLSLEIQNGEAVLGIKGLSVYSAKDHSLLLSFENAIASVAIPPLLSCRLQISSLSIKRPYIQLIRTRDAGLSVSGYLNKPGPFSRASRIAASSSSSSRMIIGPIFIEDGTVRFRDTMSVPISEITIREVDAQASGISATGITEFNMKTAFASAAQNLMLSGKAVEFVSGYPYVKDFYAETDLSTFDNAELVKAFPVFRRLGLSGPLAGIFKLKVSELKLSRSGISNISAGLSLVNGMFAIASIGTPVYGVNLSASCEGANTIVNSFSARIENGSLSGSGHSENIFDSPQTEIHLRFEVQGIKRFIYLVLGQNQNMDGNMRLEFNGTMMGRSWLQISKTLAGKGEFYLDRGTMVNMNVLNQTLSSLTLFPGLSDMVRAYVPTPIKEAFGNNDTTIEPLRQVFTVEDGYIMIPNLSLRTDTFDMRGEAKSSLTGDISGHGIIRFARSVSDAMIKVVPEMRYITDSEGMVEFPMAFKSGDEGFKMIPDLKYVGKRVAVQKAGDLVTDFLQKTADNGSGSSIAQSLIGKSEKGPKLKDFVKSLLRE